jgi:hypothetical protein
MTKLFEGGPESPRMAPRAILPLALATALLLVPAATAHATAYNTGNAASYQVKFVYGNLYEPVSTYQKTGLDLGVYDAKGNPIKGLDCVDHAGMPVASPPLATLALTYADQTLDMAKGCKAQYGKDGWYTFPVIYTRPGAYVLHIQGTINGTAVNQTIQPAHSIEDSTSEMFPAKVDSPDVAAAKVSDLTAKVGQLGDDLNALKARVSALEGKSSKGAPGVDGDLLLLGFLAALGLVARRAA